MTNRIQQLHLHVEVRGTEADGLALQQRLSALCQTWLLPAMEQVLARLAPAAGHLYFDHLELAAGTLALDRLDADLAGAVAQALEKVLREQPAAAVGRSAAARSARHRTDQEAVTEALLYFLEKGSLPWFFRLPAGRSLEQAVRALWPPAAAGWRRVLASAHARQRLTGQFSPGFWQALLAWLAPAGHDLTGQILAQLPGAGLPAEATTQFTSKLWEAAFAHAAAGNTSTAAQLVVDAWRGLPAPPPALADFVERQWPGARGASPAAPEHPASTAADEPAETEGFYIDNAGLVLLHPFLPQFLEAMGLSSGGHLQRPNRALSLLHYLATGQPVAPEYELLLPKVLCNLALEAPVAAEAALTPAEIEEADALLRAVIGHWRALRSTSPDGLRGTFLARPGKLSRRPDGDWLLQVEPQAYDILLADLPWGISMIQLPWMARLLWVEWG